MYYYRIYGLIIKSEIELPEAYEIEESEADVEIKYGIMPLQIMLLRKRALNYSVFFRKLKWFYVENEGNFLIENGHSITVELCDTADERHIRSILLGGCLGSILYQKEMVAIHGAAVVWNNKAIIVSGNSGSGKSTISTELRKRGSLFLADDTVVITSKNECVYAKPSYPQQKLCAEAAAAMGYDLNDLILIDEDGEKYAVEIKDTFCPVNKEVAALICLNVYEGDQLSVKEITGSMKLQCIISNLYSYMDYKYISMNTDVFKKCLAVAQRVPVFQITRPAGRNAAEQITESILELVESK